MIKWQKLKFRTNCTKRLKKSAKENRFKFVEEYIEFILTELMEEEEEQVKERLKVLRYL